METKELYPIGRVVTHADGMEVLLDEMYHPAMEGLEGFSHIQVLWWFDQCEGPDARATLLERAPYRAGPDRLGVFATRSPRRPNPVALSCAAITCLDLKAGRIGLDYIDAQDGSPVLDLKPYTPSIDRVECPRVPAWCADWPVSRDVSGDFDWERVFSG